MQRRLPLDVLLQPCEVPDVDGAIADLVHRLPQLGDHAAVGVPLPGHLGHQRRGLGVVAAVDDGGRCGHRRSFGVRARSVCRIVRDLHRDLVPAPPWQRVRRVVLHDAEDAVLGGLVDPGDGEGGDQQPVLALDLGRGGDAGEPLHRERALRDLHEGDIGVAAGRRLLAHGRRRLRLPLVVAGGARDEQPSLGLHIRGRHEGDRQLGVRLCAVADLHRHRGVGDERPVVDSEDLRDQCVERLHCSRTRALG
mmetsp:Transcript_67256/g.194487  ORF Transcript_67256/g.194487 Transcript_67256/m.194487 type:complete len:251 (+) Transcript_67256:2040-2792(+)